MMEEGPEIRLYVDDMHPRVSLPIILDLDNQFRSGNKHVKIRGGRTYTEETVEDPQDIHSGTPWGNTEKVQEDVPCPLMPRKEAYELADKYAKPGKKDDIYASINKTFPKEVWDDEVPQLNVLALFINKHLDDLVKDE